jgi:hypothetical protein
MNDQVMPPNSGGAGERGSGGPEDLQSGPAGREMPAPEMAPQPGSSPAPGQPPRARPPLSRDDVAAAISALPGGGSPGGAPVASSLPVVADDVDVIEPEWVAKAEQAVRTHQGDPYGEEEAVEELQEDYLDKRYGFKVADPNSDRNGGAAGKPGGA